MPIAPVWTGAAAPVAAGAEPEAAEVAAPPPIALLGVGWPEV
jgi:hypothetical protein